MIVQTEKRMKRIHVAMVDDKMDLRTSPFCFFCCVLVEMRDKEDNYVQHSNSEIQKLILRIVVLLLIVVCEKELLWRVAYSLSLSPRLCACVYMGNLRCIIQDCHPGLPGCTKHYDMTLLCWKVLFPRQDWALYRAQFCERDHRLL